MKILIPILLLIPSLSWGIDYLKKNIPISKQEFNYLYGYELGKEITNDQLTENGLKTFDPQNPKDSNYPFTYLSRNTGNSSNDTVDIGTASAAQIPFLKADGSSSDIDLQTSGKINEVLTNLHIPFTIADGTDVTTLVVA